MKVKISRLLLILSIVCFFNSCSSDSDNSVVESAPAPLQKTLFSYTYTSFEDETLAAINTYRASIGLNTLEKNNYISLKSEEHDNYMITNNAISHDHFDNRYKSIVETLGAIKVGENIAYDYSSSKGIVDAWLKSPSHKECMEGDYSHFGISIRVSSEGKIYCTTIFAKIEPRNGAN